ncbi:MAG: hypothetical protein QM426_10495 [Euryarchaeota archaeon]|nr:hypothetical protein [Euryarchaeota archaeon]
MPIVDTIANKINDCYDRGYRIISNKQFKKFCRNEQAYAGGSAIGILVLLATLMLSSLLFGTLQEQVDPKIAALGDANASASYDNVKSSGWGSIDLFSMVPYVAVFVVIIGALAGFSGRN